MKLNKVSGFTLIEVLVSMAILVFGLLGIAGLMVKGQRASYEAYQRQQALTLAQDMVERMRSNPAGAASYVAVGAGEGSNMGHGTQAFPVDCDGTVCSADQLAAFDLTKWDQLLTGSSESLGGNKVGGILNARGCIEQVGALNRYTVSVAWQGDATTVGPGDGGIAAGQAPVVACKDVDGVTNVATSTCGAGLYKDATGAVNNKNRRMVSLCLSTLQAVAGGS